MGFALHSQSNTQSILDLESGNETQPITIKSGNETQPITIKSGNETQPITIKSGNETQPITIISPIPSPVHTNPHWNKTLGMRPRLLYPIPR